MSSKKHHIFLIGPSGVGKTTIAESLSKSIGWEKVDLDIEIEKAAGMPISQFFQENGEAKFREIERNVILNACKKENSCVVATGGGSVLDTRNLVAMAKSGFVVYLSALEQDLVQRVKNDPNNSRPLLAGDLAEKIHEQLQARAACYELAADVTIATSRRDIDAVTQAIERQVKRLSSAGSDLSAGVIVGDSILSKLGNYLTNYPHVVLITQENIPDNYRLAVTKSFDEAKIKYITINVPNGEIAKSFEIYSDVIAQMSDAKITRAACVVALGGGVVGDLSGFVASTYHRGIDVIQVPTTLLAQVDSSIGGKCGINLKTGKNLVGSFHQPKLIYVDTSVLGTLRDHDFKSGLGEIAKYAILGNRKVWNLIENEYEKVLKRDPQVLVEIIKSCINQKLNVVSRDPLELTGLRATLNLGHTRAHAIETKTGYEIAHGQAVSLGLRFVCELSFYLGRISEEQKNNALKILDVLELEKVLPESAQDIESLIELMYSDKKSDGELSFVLMNSEGESELVHGIDRDIVTKTLAQFVKNHS